MRATPRPVRLRPDILSAGVDRAAQLGLPFALYVRLMAMADLSGADPLTAQTHSRPVRFSRTSTTITLSSTLWARMRRRGREIGLTRPRYIEQLITRDIERPQTTFVIFPDPKTKKPTLHSARN